MTTERADVAIVGGGIIGLATAWELAGRGRGRSDRKIVVFDRGVPGREASSAAAGMLAPLSEVRDPGAMFSALTASRDQWPDWHRELEEASGREIEFDRSGALVVSLRPSDGPAVEAMAVGAAALGERWEEVESSEADRLVPDFTGPVLRAILLPGEYRVDNVAVCRALVEACRRAGVDVRPGVGVEGIESAGEGSAVTLSNDAGGTVRIDAGAVLLAGGAWSGSIPGLPALPVRPVRGQMLRVDGADWKWNGMVRLASRNYAVRRGPSSVMLGATVEETGFRNHTTPEGVGSLLEVLDRDLPGLRRHGIASTWSGLRPGTPDDLPILGRIAPGVTVASGHYRNGILLAPWTAAEATRILDGHATDGVFPEFSPRRFGVGVPDERPVPAPL